MNHKILYLLGTAFFTFGLVLWVNSAKQNAAAQDPASSSLRTELDTKNRVSMASIPQDSRIAIYVDRPRQNKDGKIEHSLIAGLTVKSGADFRFVRLLGNFLERQNYQSIFVEATADGKSVRYDANVKLLGIQVIDKNATLFLNDQLPIEFVKDLAQELVDAGVEKVSVKSAKEFEPWNYSKAISNGEYGANLPLVGR